MNLRPYIQFNRKISSKLTVLLARTPLTPNHVTAMALIAGVAAGFWMTRGSHASLLIGAAFLHLSFILDNCDGELARLKNKVTTTGKWFDTIADLSVDFALWSGLAAGAVHHHDVGPWIAIGLAACTGSLINFGIVVTERRLGASRSIHVAREQSAKEKNSFFHSILETLCHNGDCIVLVWLASLFASPGLFLIFGCVYINAIWITRSMVYFAKWRSIAIKVAAVALGVYLFILAMKDVSWADLASMGPKAVWALAVSFFIFPGVTFFHSMGFYYLLPPKTRAQVSAWQIFRAFLAGDSINKITPFLDVAGEPMKAQLLARQGLAMDEVVQSLWRARIVFVLTEVAHLVPALAILVIFFPSRDYAVWTMMAMVFSTVFAGILYAGKRKVVGRAPEKVSVNDAWQAFVWNLGGWIAFTAETYVSLRILGVPVTLTQAFLLQALLQAIKTLSFFIPANLGAQEGGLAMLMKHLGFTATEGVALSILKRARQFLWALAGYGIYVLNDRKNEILTYARLPFEPTLWLYGVARKKKELK